ncbi:MAG: HAMP domain-containing protein [Kiritimatiellae bacterium]|nr:HAMP domain-containing protein [Kiritimatiellia bacterium]
MKIRTRLTLWYAGVLFASLILLTFITYYELLKEGIVTTNILHLKDYDKSGLKEIIEITLLCGIPAALLGLLGGWFLIQKALKPIGEMTMVASRIHEGNLKARLPCSGNGDEIDTLSDVFNQMTTRLDNSFQQIHEFTLHASHELKTPLTILHGELENALKDKDLSSAQSERVACEIDEVQRLARIVDGLTFLTKAGAGRVAFAKELLRFDELLRDAYADALVLAKSQDVTVTLADCEETWIHGDRHRLRQLLLNLTDNAVKYNRVGGMLQWGCVRTQMAYFFRCQTLALVSHTNYKIGSLNPSLGEISVTAIVWKDVVSD